jgi:predicted XRE-type DNA-binding protein
VLAQSPRRCERCGCQLSQYNSGTLCSACLRSHSLTPPAPSVPERVWRNADVQQALATLDFGKATRLIRQHGSLRQEDVAQLTGLSQAFLSMLEAGRRRLTNIDKIVEFLTGLGVPPELAPLPCPAVQHAPVVEVEWESPKAG